ncbi:ABC transporter ATP-binding protein [Rubrolithibacter danxiaensis]|uniref:ABC transporter ATP-binding protein n=1 Tax=Rubrolithibacter danxiaensis TaxID=3390805 RepID=UPI003BF89307
MPEHPLISLTGIHKQYTTEVFAGVRDINLEIIEGKIVSIVGASGSGKSTLLKLIYGLLSPEKGEVLFEGKKVLGPEEKLIPGHGEMKMVTQNFDLNTYAKVYDNIAAMLPNTDLQAKKQKSFEAMELLRIGHLAEKRIVDLSGGEQQRVAIARAIITAPKVLLMDEPFSQIDALLKNQLRSDLRRLSRVLGITIILVSHDPADGLSLADELVILRNGIILERGAPRKLYNHPEHFYTAQLLGNCNVITRAEAKAIGVSVKKSFAAIYPEWIRVKNSWTSKLFTVKDSYYKGFYEELVLEKDGVLLRAMNLTVDNHQPGTKIQVLFSRFLEFDDE